MPPSPKPKKSDRIAEQKTKHSELIQYRRVQAALAISRDNSLCVVCYFTDGLRVNREEVHHVFGRGIVAGDYREHYTNLMCVCRKHHPHPIKGDVPKLEMEWIEHIRKQANKTPINPHFIIPSKPIVELL